MKKALILLGLLVSMGCASQAKLYVAENGEIVMELKGARAKNATFPGGYSISAEPVSVPKSMPILR